MENPMKHSDVVFMYTPDAEIYKAYEATWVAWGSASKKAVETAHEFGIHYAASMWTLTAGAENLHKRADLRDAVSKDILLEPIVVPWLWDHTYEGTPSYFGCTNHPVFREFSRQRVISAMETGADGLHIDDHLGSAGSFWHGGCFCDFCVEEFRKFLKQDKYRDKLEMHDIDIEDFNYRDFLRERVSSREEYKDQRGKLPLTEIYWLYQTRSAAAFVLELRKLAEEVRGKPITCSANTFMPNPVHLVVTPNLTHCVGEADFRLEGKNPPESSAIAVFKLMDAIDRTMAATGSGWNWAYAHANDNAVGLVGQWIAESYALGHRLMVPHRKWAFTQEKGTHWYQSKPEDFAYLYKFVRANAHLLDGYEPYSQIALIMSNRRVRRVGMVRFRDFCKQLADANIQFSIIVAGDEWLGNRLTAEALSEFDTVILPEPAELSNSQEEILTVWEGEKVKKVKKVNRVLPDDDRKIIESITPAVQVLGAKNVWVLPRLRPESPLVCHILNRNYDEYMDTIAPVNDVEIILGAELIGDRNISSCELLSPENGVVELEGEMKGNDLHIPIKELGMWSLLVVHH